MATTTSETLVVCESLLEEHRQTESLLDRMEILLTLVLEQNHVSQSVYDELFKLTEILVKESGIHFACEEQCLFPVLSQYQPMVLMEVEHEELIAWLEKYQNALTAHEPEVAPYGLQLIKELRDHISREDVGIFPAAERRLTEAEKCRVIEAMQQVRADAKLGSNLPELSLPQRKAEVFHLNFSADPSRALYLQNLYEQDSLIFKQFTIQAGKALTSHWSPYPLYLVLLAGTGVFCENDCEYPLTPGECLAIEPRLRFGIRAESTCHFLMLNDKRTANPLCHIKDPE